ncbi:MAG: serine hydrolase [Patescibacteria group bacterium]
MFWNAIANLILILLFGFNGLAPRVNSDVRLITLSPAAAQPEIRAPRSAVLSADGRFFLFARNADEVQPIASITKLMTALVFLENNPGWEETYKITPDDEVEGGKWHLFRGEEVTMRDLFYTSLVASDNGATLALVHASGLSEADFVSRMNAKARALGLARTSFVDPIGLSDKDVSTAREVALLAQSALKAPEIREATTKSTYEFTTQDGRNKQIDSTDYLLFDPVPKGLQVLGGKTGYTDQAGYCFVGRLQDASGREVIAVILNSDGKNERFRESKYLANWVFNSYNWKR